MLLTDEIKQSIDECVLCWLATVDHGYPNVSPKEMFIHFGDDKLLIANIASPTSIKNIKANPKVCVSFVHVLKQKGFKLTGEARIVEKSDNGFTEMKQRLYTLGGNDFEIKSVIEISVTKATPIVAPSYWLFPDTTEASQIESAKKTYSF